MRQVRRQPEVTGDTGEICRQGLEPADEMRLAQAVVGMRLRDGVVADALLQRAAALVEDDALVADDVEEALVDIDTGLGRRLEESAVE